MVKRDENGMIMPVKSTYPALTSDKSKLSNVYGTGDKTEEEPKSAEQAEKRTRAAASLSDLTKYTRLCRLSANIRTAKAV